MTRVRIQPPVSARGLACICVTLTALVGCVSPSRAASATEDLGAWAVRMQRAVTSDDRASCAAGFAPDLARICEAWWRLDRRNLTVRSATAAGDGDVIEVSWRPTEASDVATQRLRVRLDARSRATSVGRDVISAVPLWALEDMPSATVGNAVLLGACPAGVGEAASRALERVRAWPLGPLAAGWNGVTVVDCPADANAYAAVTGQDFGSDAGIAARTMPLGSDPHPAVHVVLNPTSLPSASRDVENLLTHEFVHAATRSFAWKPLWIVEGLADAVMADDDFRRTWNDKLVSLAHRDGVPDALPANSDFARTDESLQVSYAASRLAVDVLRDHVGDERAALVLQAWSAGDTAVAQGVSITDLTAWWRERLSA